MQVVSLLTKAVRRVSGQRFEMFRVEEEGREMRFEIRSRFAKVGIEMEVEGNGLAALLE